MKFFNGLPNFIFHGLRSQVKTFLSFIYRLYFSDSPKSNTAFHKYSQNSFLRRNAINMYSLYTKISRMATTTYSFFSVYCTYIVKQKTSPVISFWEIRRGFANPPNSITISIFTKEKLTLIECPKNRAFIQILSTFSFFPKPTRQYRHIIFGCILYFFLCFF